MTTFQRRSFGAFGCCRAKSWLAWKEHVVVKFQGVSRGVHFPSELREQLAMRDALRRHAFQIIDEEFHPGEAGREDFVFGWRQGVAIISHVRLKRICRQHRLIGQARGQHQFSNTPVPRRGGRDRSAASAYGSTLGRAAGTAHPSAISTTCACASSSASATWLHAAHGRPAARVPGRHMLDRQLFRAWRVGSPPSHG